MNEFDYKNLYFWSTNAFRIAETGLIVGIFFKILLLAIPMRWTFWYGLCRLIYLVAIWAFRIGVPLFLILFIAGLVQSAINRIADK